MTINSIDIAIGIERHLHEWPTIDAEIPRPEGFRVIEEINYKPCVEWKGEKSGKYAVYLLEKTNVDHFTAIYELTKILKRKVNYIGIKDTNAITSQIVYTDSSSTVQEFESNGIKLKFLGYSNQKFNHTGNIFRIKLVTSKFDEVVERIKVINKDTFIPAFVGYQRFGTRRPMTHVIGYYIVKKDWYNAVMSILAYPFYSESDLMKDIRKMIMEGNYKEALSFTPSKFKQERVLLKNLIKNNNFFLALKNSFIPLSFYVEAYQSYLFNKLLSRKMNDIERNSILGIYSDIRKCDEICKEIYDEEGIDPSNFKIKELKINKPQLVRKAFTEVRNLKADEKNNEISFALDRGMYATVFLVELLNIDARKIT
ncbi:tRNA pseudouridine(13) synthase TruD [Acidianus hospitalis]|uniref:tRNA pseudouridine(13) synthase TruD n=1 Tax=Acidianus TaxID=12914 RepID=UPI00064F45A4|nr:tRNA pseudouridine(13) synthase TruD [Acidianus hospitalis]